MRRNEVAVCTANASNELVPRKKRLGDRGAELVFHAHAVKAGVAAVLHAFGAVLLCYVAALAAVIVKMKGRMTGTDTVMS